MTGANAGDVIAAIVVSYRSASTLDECLVRVGGAGDLTDWGGEAEWNGARRSLVLGGGTKLTLEAEAAQGIVLHTSI